MILILSDTELEKVKNSELIQQCKTVVVIKRNQIDLVKNAYRYINGKYTKNDLMRLLRNLIEIIRKGK